MIWRLFDAYLSGSHLINAIRLPQESTNAGGIKSPMAKSNVR